MLPLLMEPFCSIKWLSLYFLGVYWVLSISFIWACAIHLFLDFFGPLSTRPPFPPRSMSHKEELSPFQNWRFQGFLPPPFPPLVWMPRSGRYAQFPRVTWKCTPPSASLVGMNSRAPSLFPSRGGRKSWVEAPIDSFSAQFASEGGEKRGFEAYTSQSRETPGYDLSSTEPL